MATTLTRDSKPLHAHSTVTYAVHVGGQLVGYVADYRNFTGSRFGGRRWMALHNPTGEHFGTQWRGEDYRTRAAAVDALLARTVDADLDDPRVW